MVIILFNLVGELEVYISDCFVFFLIRVEERVNVVFYIFGLGFF